MRDLVNKHEHARGESMVCAFYDDLELMHWFIECIIHVRIKGSQFRTPG